MNSQILNAAKRLLFPAFALGSACFVVWLAIEYFTQHGFSSYLMISYFSSLLSCLAAQCSFFAVLQQESAHMENDKVHSLMWEKATLLLLFTSSCFFLLTFFVSSWFVLEHATSNTAVLNFIEIFLLSSLALLLFLVPSHYFIKLSCHIMSVYPNDKTTDSV